MKIKNLFFDAKKYSSKYDKYFEVYENQLKPFLNKKIILVEIGVLDGGSLEIWKKYFGSKARIIGIDLNPECKKYEQKGIEVFIGDQSCTKFWKSFFNKVGKVDIIVDDGGHTNFQQIISTVATIPNIKDNGILIVEDTHSSYLSEFSNPSKYSFIEFVKKIIDDINFSFNKSIGSFKFSLKEHIYSIQIFESIVVFYINRKKTYENYFLENRKLSKGLRDYRYAGSKFAKFYYSRFIYKFKFLIKIRFFNYIWKKIIFFARFNDNINEIKKYIKYFK